MFRHMILVAIVVACCSAADWSRFRGSDGSGLATDASLPETWGAREHLAWKTPLPGYGSSSPITCGDKVFLTCYSGYGLARQEPGQQERLVQHVLCLDRHRGELIWEKKIEPTLPETHYDAGRVNLHGYASATPVTDGESLYVFFGKTGVLRFDLDGQLIWKTAVGSGLDSHNWGSAASPILFHDLVIVNASAESQSIRALKKSNGQEVWRFTAEGAVVFGQHDGGVLEIAEPPKPGLTI
ncbi:PQQ-binding-like beta-propeller repeat protein [Planctomycetota bacterium]